MQSQGGLSESQLQERIKQFAFDKWESLPATQKIYAKRILGVITYKWRWQIAMNIPYLAIFALDKTIPAVHEFDMALLANITSKLPIPAFMTSLFGIG
ncbi:hypothetical protein [Prochlorococcus marinus]|uniref:hypothetical protein n=1 Tax=Prochlorococcus marinus TaxID=1219 RepID=UPI0022B5BFD4|nr:hypothetical protein [Prochlorococcus marinus]